MYEKNLDLNWFDLPLVALDVETTGLNPEKDRIMEIAMVHFEKGEIKDQWSTFVNPQMDIPKKAKEITGISDADVSMAPTFDRIAQDVLSKLKNNIIVAYNLDFDRSFVQAELRRVNLKWPEDHPQVDPLIFAIQFYPGRRVRRRLVDVAKRLGITLTGAHRALNDTIAVGQVLYALKPRLPKTLRELLKVQQEWYEMQQRTRGLENVGLKKSVNQKTLGASFVYGGESDPLRAYYAQFQGQ